VLLHPPRASFAFTPDVRSLTVTTFAPSTTVGIGKKTMRPATRKRTLGVHHAMAAGCDEKLRQGVVERKDPPIPGRGIHRSAVVMPTTALGCVHDRR